MNKKVFAFCGATFLLFMATYSMAQGVMTDPMITGLGARPLAMGRAFDAVADDTNAIFTNPAGLIETQTWQGMTMVTTLMDDVHYVLGGILIPCPWGMMGLGYQRRSVDDIELSDSAGNNLGTTPFADNLFVVSNAFLVGDFPYVGVVQGGVNLKLYNASAAQISESNVGGYSFDLGFLSKPFPRWTLSLVQSNAWSSLIGQSGLTDTFLPRTQLGASYLFENFPMLLSGEIELGWTRPTAFHLGAEIRTFSFLKLRAGIDQRVRSQNGESALSTGISLGLGFSVSDFNFDYAYVPFYEETQTVTHYLSLSYIFKPAPSIHATVSPVNANPGKTLTIEASIGSPYEIKMVKALFPDHTEQNLALDPDTQKWLGFWTVPEKGIALGQHQVILSAEDAQGSHSTLESDPFNIWAPDATFEKIVSLDQTEVFQDTIRISGIMSRALSLNINGKPVPFDPDSGRFNRMEKLNIGKNFFRVLAIGESQRPVVREIRVLRMAKFDDVDDDAFASKEIQKIGTLSLIPAYSNNQFQPQSILTRMDLAVLISKLISSTKQPEFPEETTSNFKDIQSDYWGLPYILLAVSGGYLNGYEDHTFRPFAPVTRMQAMAALVRLDNIPVVAENKDTKFTDLASDYWGSPYLRAAIDHKLITERAAQGEFFPNEAITRGMFAYWLRKTNMIQHLLDDLYRWDSGYSMKKNELTDPTNLSPNLEAVIPIHSPSANISLILPEDKTIVFGSQVNLTGKAEHSAHLFCQNFPISVSSNGYFKKTIPLSFGKNDIMAFALNSEGDKTDSLFRRVLCLPDYSDLDPEMNRYMLGYMGVLLGISQSQLNPHQILTEKEGLNLLKKITDFDAPVQDQPLTRGKAIQWLAAFVENKLDTDSLTENQIDQLHQLSGTVPYEDLQATDEIAHPALFLLKHQILKSGKYFYPSAKLTKLEWIRLLSKTPVVRNRIKKLVDWKRGYVLQTLEQQNEIRTNEILNDDFNERALNLFPNP